jgi:hypothetical protein
MGQVKTLAEVIAALDSLDSEDTIYAVEPWTKESQAVVAREPEAGGLPDEARRIGAKYFLEVFVAHDFVEDWKTGLRQEPAPTEMCARLIYYAINDA